MKDDNMTKFLTLVAAATLPFMASCATPATDQPADVVTTQDMITVSGTASYRERIALPPGAVTLVSIEDVSLADAPSKTLAEQRIAMDGKSVPVAFTLEVPRASLASAHQTNLRVRIEDGQGRLLFITDTYTPVTIAAGSTHIVIDNVMLVKVAG